MKSYFFRNKYFYIVYEILKQNHKITNVYVYCVCIQVCILNHWGNDGFENHIDKVTKVMKDRRVSNRE